MAYIGVDVNYSNIASQVGVGNGSTTPIATLDYNVSTSSSIIVTLDGVTQVPTTDYTASGTTLTFTSTVASPIAILVVFLGRSLDIGTPADGTVTNAKVDGSAAIATSKLSGAVTSIASHGLASSATTDTTNASNIASGTLPVARGGTGAATHTSNNVMIGAGTSALTSIAPSTSGNVLTSNGSTWASTAPAGGGGILQVKHATKVAVQTLSGDTSRIDISDLSITITPTASTSKFLVSFHVSHATANDGTVQVERQIASGSFALVTPPTAAGSRTLTHSGGVSRIADELNSSSMQCLDAPATASALTYKITYNNRTGTSGYINKSTGDADNISRGRAISTLTVMEIDVAVL